MSPKCYAMPRDDYELCDGKRCLSRREAGEAINHAKKSHMGMKKIPKRAYRCRKCGTYHTTAKALGDFS